jgi:LmbE family N-acetylglucosaminyl deacetylase
VSEQTAAATPEIAWASSPVLANLPGLPLPTGRVLVVSAHPDDEVLGAGGLLAALTGTTASLTFVCVTDGEASHPGAGPKRRAELAAARPRELVQALQTLGLHVPRIRRLGLPDSAVSHHLERLRDDLAEPVRRADLAICPVSFDGHSDHAAVATATAEVCSGAVPLLEIPIWLWHWRSPDDHAIPWERARRFELSADEVRTKRAALSCFSTQVRPWPPDDGTGTTMLTPDVLDHFSRPFEVFFT